MTTYTSPLNGGTQAKKPMTKKIVNVGDYRLEALTKDDMNEMITMIRDKKNDNMDDEYAYSYFNRLEAKVFRIAMALQAA